MRGTGVDLEVPDHVHQDEQRETIPVSAMTSFSVLDDGCTCHTQRPCGLIGFRGTS
jgi:hypothetical protein